MTKRIFRICSSRNQGKNQKAEQDRSLCYIENYLTEAEPPVELKVLGAESTPCRKGERAPFKELGCAATSQGSQHASLQPGQKPRYTDRSPPVRKRGKGHSREGCQSIRPCCHRMPGSALTDAHTELWISGPALWQLVLGQGLTLRLYPSFFDTQQPAWNTLTGAERPSLHPNHLLWRQ